MTKKISKEESDPRKKASDEEIGELYYSFWKGVKDLRAHYKIWEKKLNSIQAYLETPFMGGSEERGIPEIKVKDLLNSFPDQGFASVPDKAHQLLHTRSPSGWAYYFTSVLAGVSEGRIKKRKKKYYKK